MNRSFKGRESLMPSIRQSFPQLRSELRDKEDDLGFFLELRKRDKDKNDLLLLNDTEELNDSLVSQPGSSPLFNIPAARKTGPDDFLSSDCEKNDYDWLLTPPGTPLFPSLDMESKKAYMDEAEAPKARPTVLRSRLANSQLETTARSNSLPRPTVSTGLSSSISGMRKPSPSAGPGSRSVTPTGRPTLSSPKPSTPTSRATPPSAKSVGHSSPKLTGSLSTRSSTPTRSAARPAAPSAGPSRSSTPSKSTARSSTPTGATAPSIGPSRSSTPSKSTARSSMPTGTTAPSAGPSRSSTPSKSTARSSTPTGRPTAPAARPTSRTSTPTRRPSVPPSLSNAMSSASLNKSSSSLSSKSGSAPSRNTVPSRGVSPTVKSKSWKPSEMPGFSLDAPPNLRTTLPSRPLSATRGRPAAPSARSASLEPANNGRRRQSCSPSRGRSPSLHPSGSSVPAVSRGHSKVNDDVSPVVIGTRMVERVVHMRKLVPPRQDDKHSSSLSGKSASSPDSSGFGRSLSKKSLDMAMRHMDIRRSIPGNLRPLMTKIPASSLYSVRSGALGNGTASISDSPIATNSNASSDHGVNNHVVALDKNRSEMEDNLQ